MPFEPAPKSSRAPSIVEFTIVEGPEAWKVEDYEGQEHKYTTILSESDIKELEAAMEVLNPEVVDIKSVTKEHFPLPTLGPKLEAIQKEVTWGRGFALVKGLPVWRWTRRQSILAYWGIGLHWGKAGANNAKGHLVGHIKDIGHDPRNPTTRLYATHEGQPWHNDISDLVSLLCLKQAKSGGASSWASSISVYNEIVKRAPDLARVLAGPWWFYDRKGEVPPGKQPYFLIPVFNFHKGYLTVNFSANYYHSSQRFPEVPRLTPEQLAAIKLFEELAASQEHAIHYILEPGDIQLLNNHTCLHHRTAFEDFEDPAEKRHLLRLWLSPAEERELAPVYSELYGGSLQVGNRGAIKVPEELHVITEEAE